jgi:phosphoribosylanthranilate isomerase
MTLVKICGVRRLEDAIVAVDAGADVIGVNFWPGTKRSLPVAEAAAMLAALRAEWPTLPPICGLFVNADAETIHATVTQCDLDFVQLAGDETPDDLARLTMPVIKTVRPLPDETPDALSARIGSFYDAAHHLPPGPFGSPLVPLIDANVPGFYGGTGQRADWSFVAALRRESSVVSREREMSSPHDARLTTHDFLLAGGLTPDNVGAAVRAVRPWGVDVASGVEIPGQPGVKDPERVRAFVRAVRGCDAQDSDAQ